MLFWRRRAREQELERELRDHLELEAEEQQEAGSSAEEARYAARRALGNPSLVKETTREAWGGALLETLSQDLRYAFRSLRASPVFALVAISSLGLGIGANTAIFSFVNAILLTRLPVPEAERLVQLSEFQNGKQINSVFSFPFLSELDKRNGAFDGVLGRFPVRVNLDSDAVTEPLNGEVVTGNYFRTLRVKPALGRLLTEEDVNAGAKNPVCVLSYSKWQGRFAGDPGIIGRKLLLNSHPYIVVGVTQKGFSGAQLRTQIDVQLPVSRMGDFMGGFFATGPGGAMWKSPNFSWLDPLARLRPGITAAQAQAMVGPIAQSIKIQLQGPHPDEGSKSGPTTFRLTDGSQGANYNSDYAKPVAVLMGIVALVLLIACANLANLLLARANARAKEFAVRLSVGASRSRLIRQLMVESLALSSCGGLAGLALAFWIIRTLLAYLNVGETNGNGLHVSALNPTVLSFSVSLSLLTAALFGVAPAWQSARPDMVSELKGAREKTGAGGVGARRFLIVFQIALSLMILFASGLLTQTLSRLKTIDLGFDPARVINLRVDPAMSGHTAAAIDRTFNEILGRLRTQPGIVAAGLAVVSPLEGSAISLNFEVPGHTTKSSDVQTSFNMVSPDYFRTLNQGLLAGRDFSDHDTKTSSNVAVVNQLFAAQYMPGQSPIGRHFKVGNSDTEIVGLVRNARYQSLREKPWPLIYLPAEQTQSSGYTLLVRTRLEAQRAVAEIEHTIRSVDSKLPIYDVHALQDQVDSGISSERVLSFLSTLFSALATLLCSMGIYGLVAYSVSRRTREIGIRFCIGAQKGDVARLFLREGVLLVAAGIIVGIPLALASTRVLKSLLYGIEPSDALTLAVTVAIFLAAGLLASVLPVRRATRIAPLEALRHE